jgi:hypothetical protein
MSGEGENAPFDATTSLKIRRDVCSPLPGLGKGLGMRAD